MLIALTALACTPDEKDTAVLDSAEEVDYPAVHECAEVVLEFNGNDPPRVGDLWTIWLNCDGRVLMGASRIAVDPVEAATLDENELTWALAGEATIDMQTGQTKGSRTVTVQE